MELWRRADNPWGQDVLIGISWDLMWAAAAAALLFLVGHALWIRSRPKGAAVEPSEAPAGLPDRIERHSMSARVFHWTMSATMLTLLVTAFVPVIGLQFAWVQIHWIAGVLLIASVIYHVIHAIGWQDFWAMYKFGVTEGMAALRHLLSSRAPAPPKGGKYPFDHRLYHHAIVVVSTGAIVTGVLMMLRIDTPFWNPNPYFLSDTTWGVMYVVHGLSGVSLILLIASHIYFALRPEKRWITWSMIRGWIDRDHYLEHFDPTEWVVTDRSVESHEGGAGALADSTVRAPRRED
jgi:formate dehydrogenase subunit gamma